MSKEIINFKPIGIVHTPFKKLQGMPIQPTGAVGVKGQIEIFPELNDGLKDLDGFSHIILLYNFHKVKESKLKVIPFLDKKVRGVFATRAPRRPNAIGLSIVKLVEINGNIIQIENVDILDGTPLLDIKPYIPHVDQQEVLKLGWLENKTERFEKQISDERFIENE
jgi:tRNA (adenine37-N6)-methyltransferase